MGLLNGLRNCLAFLTIIPVQMDPDALKQVAEYIPLFPVIGAGMGLLTGVFVWAIGLVLPSLLTGILGVGFLLMLNGVQHFDGLLDFGDALMCHGTRERKLRVMNDPHVGAGGLSLGLVVVVATAFSVTQLDTGPVIQSLVASEAIAKFAMVLQARFGNPAQKGMGSLLIQSMKKKWGISRFALAFLLAALIVAASGLRLIGAFVITIGIVVPLVILSISTRAFGGITGDIMGATNELTRLVSLIVIVGALR